MSPRALAVVLLRTSGVISIVVSSIHLIAYIPMIGDVLNSEVRHPTAGGVFRTLLFPSLAGVVGGLVLLIFAGWLSRVVTRGLE